MRHTSSKEFSLPFSTKVTCTGTPGATSDATDRGWNGPGVGDALRDSVKLNDTEGGGTRDGEGEAAAVSVRVAYSTDERLSESVAVSVGAAERVRCGMVRVARRTVAVSSRGEAVAFPVAVAVAFGGNVDVTSEVSVGLAVGAALREGRYVRVAVSRPVGVSSGVSVSTARVGVARYAVAVAVAVAVPEGMSEGVAERGSVRVSARRWPGGCRGFGVRLCCCLLKVFFHASSPPPP